MMKREQRAELARRLVARFRQLKDEEGWTQQTLADESGVPLRTVSDTLREVSVPNADKLGKMLSAVGLEAEAQDERDSWPRDVKVFLDTIGIILVAQEDREREHTMRQITRSLTDA